MSFSIIVARDLNNGIGKDNKLLFHIKEDMKRFKDLTTNHIVIMGRKTKESLPKGHLPNRINIVLSKHCCRRQYPILDDTKDMDSLITSCSNIDTLINTYKDSEEEVFIIGGSSIYKQFLPYCDKIYLTRINSIKDSDSFFEFNENEYSLVNVVNREGFSFLDYIKLK